MRGKSEVDYEAYFVKRHIEDHTQYYVGMYKGINIYSVQIVFGN